MNRDKGLDQTNDYEPRIDLGFFIHYECIPLMDISFGIQTSWVGAVGGHYWNAFGSNSRVVRYTVIPNYRIAYSTKHKLAVLSGLGISLDNVDPSIGPKHTAIWANLTDTFTLSHVTNINNYWGISLQPTLKLKLQLENGSSLNINFIAALGLIPLVSQNYTYSHNQDKYYTELISNGSFFRIGIGYEFQLLKKRYGYNTKEKINGTNKYIYK